MVGMQVRVICLIKHNYWLLETSCTQASPKLENLECWRDIGDYEGLYQISNKGRVRRLFPNSIHTLKLNPQANGYLTVNLSKNCEYHTHYVHQLVATAFLGPHQNLEVNHKDENKHNNNLNNLEWCNRKYNVNFGTRNERAGRTMGKKIRQLRLDGTLVNEFDSISLAARSINKNHGNICLAVSGKRPNAYGFIWEAKEPSNDQ